VRTVFRPGVSGACINEGSKDIVLGHLGKVHAADDLEKAHGHRDIKPRTSRLGDLSRHWPSSSSAAWPHIYNSLFLLLLLG
jgi:hypothetical protein